MRKLLLTFLLSTLSLVASAYDAKIDGIYYNLTDSTKKAEVTCLYGGSSSNSSAYSGSVTIPSSVTLDGITYAVTRIGYYAFNCCHDLTSVTIPSSVTSIGDWAFCYCTGLTSITIPSSVTSISYEAFYGCTGLTSITIPSSVTSIDNNAFQNCTSLTSIILPSSVTSIDDEAFYGCKGLTSITIPSSVTSIGNYAFSGCYIASPNLKNESSFDLSNYGLTICDIEQADGLLIKDNSAIYCRRWATSVTIPEDVVDIRSYAFQNCTSLTSITIPSSVTSIGEYAFSGCNISEININIQDISVDKDFLYKNLPNNSIRKYYLNGKPLTEIPEGTTSIGRYALYNYTDLISITIPSSVTSIGNSAFESCTGLTSITIPTSVTRIGNYAFRNCTGLTSITIPSSVTSIGSAFYGCYIASPNLKNESHFDLADFGLTICDTEQADGLLIKDNCAIFCRRWATSVTISSSIARIGSSAFADCNNITQVNVNVQDIEANSILHDYLPDSATWKYYISGKLLTKIPEGTAAIGDYALYNYKDLSSITIPSSVTSVGEAAFYGCKLRTIIAKQTDPSNYKFAFSNITYTHAPLYVPEGTYWTYVYDSDWGWFNEIREMANSASEVSEDKCYMLADEQGCNYTVWDGESKALKTVAYTFGLDEEADGTYWQVIRQGNQCALYNLGANQYGAMDSKGNITLSTAPVQMSIETSQDGTITINGLPRMLVVSQNTDITPVQCIQASATQSRDGKYLRQGRLVIRRDGREYNASGVSVK